MRIAVLWLAFGVSASMAQTILPIPLFPVQLKEYLGLSDDQINRIATIRAQFASFQQTRLLRQYQLQAEIAEETAKTNPDPLALGIRYAEIESIRRGLQTQQGATVTQTQAILSVGQRAKLITLQQALALYSTACSAVDQNLMSFPVIPQAGNVIPIERVGVPVASGCAGFSLPFILGGVLSPAPIVLQP